MIKKNKKQKRKRAMLFFLLLIFVVIIRNDHLVKYADSTSAEKAPPNERHIYDPKQSDGEASVLEFWECRRYFHCHYSQIHSEWE